MSETTVETRPNNDHTENEDDTTLKSSNVRIPVLTENINESIEIDDTNQVENKFLTEQVVNATNNEVKDQRIIQSTTAKIQRIKKMNWKMNIVKDILSSNLKYQPGAACTVIKPIKKTPKINKSENTIPFEPLTITFINDNKTFNKKIKTTDYSKDSRLVIETPVQDNIRKIVENKTDIMEIDVEPPKEIIVTMPKESQQSSTSETIDELFRKTKAQPQVYWCALSEQKVIQRLLEKQENLKSADEKGVKETVVA